MTEESKEIKPDWNAVGVFGIWAWRVHNTLDFLIEEGQGHLWPPKSAVYLDLRAGKFENLVEALKITEVKSFVVHMISLGATHLTIGTGGKWQIYNLLDSDNAKEIAETIGMNVLIKLRDRLNSED